MSKPCVRGTDLIGRRFGKQVVTRALGNAKVEIKCDCGTAKATRFQYLLSGESKSCGCGRYDTQAEPIAIGDVFERLTVTQSLGTNGRKRQVLARCSCGTQKVFNECDLRGGTVKSCGCLRKERAAGLNRSHGESGKLRTSLYQTWISMWERTTRRDRWPSYAGIGVHPEWTEFAAFKNYIDTALGERPAGHSLDRIDNNANYEPGNLKWSSAKEQARNRKSTVLVTVGNETKCLKDWADTTGISASLISSRIKNGWRPEDAVSIPRLRRNEEE